MNISEKFNLTILTRDEFEERSDLRDAVHFTSDEKADLLCSYH